MNQPRQILTWLTAVVLGMAVLPVRAQWLTQNIALKAGWNAVFLHVDAGHATVDELVGSAAPVPTPIEEVWRWNATPATAQFILSPQEPVDTGTQWSSWRRAASSTAALQRLTANTAYLVYATADFAWALKGRPVLPAYRWSTSGLNFVGFPTVATNPPNFESFLVHAPTLQFGEIYRYPGGALGTNNPLRVFTWRTTPVTRGEAFWLRAGQAFNEYYGPFEVTAAGARGAAFDDALSTYSFRVRNLTSARLTVALQLRGSEAPPAGQPAIAGTPPLLVRGDLNLTNLTHAAMPLVPETPRTWELAPRGQDGSDLEVVLGLDRAAITTPVGQVLAGVLQLTDALGQTRVDWAVSATAASPAGLWVGAAAVNEVSQYLQTYLRDAGNRLVVSSNGTYVVTGLVTNLTPVPPASAFPLRLILHNPEVGPATLWQRVFVGFNAVTNPVVANAEAALNRGLLAEARRLTATHLPWSEANAGWTFSSPLGQGALLTTTVTNAFQQRESNPFLHTYHPDHDNLDPGFRREVPQGSESYTIVREIALSVRPPGDDFKSRTSAGDTLGGDYLETIRLVGLARAGNTFDARRFDVRGGFELQRISRIATLTRVP